MKKLFSVIVISALYFAFSAGSTIAQGKYGIVGKKFTKAEAHALFGKVIGTVRISRREMKEALANAKDYVLIKVKNSRPYLLDERRSSIMPNVSLQLAPEETAYVFSTSVVQDFVASSTADTFTVEVRAEVVTLSDGSNILEDSLPCPPSCE